MLVMNVIRRGQAPPWIAGNEHYPAGASPAVSLPTAAFAAGFPDGVASLALQLGANLDEAAVAELAGWVRARRRIRCRWFGVERVSSRRGGGLIHGWSRSIVCTRY